MPEYIRWLAAPGATVEASLIDARSILEHSAVRKRLIGPVNQSAQAAPNHRKQVRISLATPFYKSARYTEELYERAIGTIRKITPDYEIIFVNDGSPEDDLRITKTMPIAIRVCS